LLFLDNGKRANRLEGPEINNPLNVPEQLKSYQDSPRASITLPFKTSKTPIRISYLAFLRFVCLGYGVTDYLYGFTEDCVTRARRLSADFLVYANRPWLGEKTKLSLNDEVSVAVLSIENYDKWFSGLKKQTRTMIRKSEKDGITTYCLDRPSSSEAEGIFRLFTETPFREGRYFEGYHTWNTSRVFREFGTTDQMVSVLATFEDKIVGVSRIIFEDKAAVVQTLLSSVRIRDSIRGVSNSMIATLVQEASKRGIRYLIYGKMGILPGLDAFRVNNGFRPIQVAYNYLPLTRKAELFAKFGIYRPKDLLFSIKLKGMVSSAESLQKYIPIPIIQRFHLYA
jgi:hypothetical protein